MTLFRPESLLNRQQGWLGSIQVVQPVPLRWLTFGVLATVIAAGTLLFFGEYTRKARLSGVLAAEHGLIDVQPPVPGVVMEWLVREGQEVQAGEPLLRLRTDALRDRAAPVSEQEEDVLGRQTGGSPRAGRPQAQPGEGAPPSSGPEDKPRQTAQRPGLAAPIGAGKTGASARGEAQASVRQWVVRAPTGGRMAALLVSAGQAVPVDAALALLLPAGARLRAQLDAPASARVAIRPGQRVWLRLQAYPYPIYGLQPGTVSEVAWAPLPRTGFDALAAGDGAAHEPMYRITVTLDAPTVRAEGGPRPLLPGLRLEADVLLERRRLIDWLWAPRQAEAAGG